MPSSRSHQLRRAVVRITAAAGIAGIVTAGGVLAPTASAHVTVSSPDAVAGGYGKLIFRMPTESAKASTKRLTVRLPDAMPFAHVSTRPKPGWSVHTTTTKLPEPVEFGDITLTKAVTTVTWRAKRPSAEIPAGSFDEFALSVGPFPDHAGTLMVRATQVYTGGTVVRWNDRPEANGEEPEHPAPSLRFAPAADTQAITTRTPSPAATTAGVASASGDPIARTLGSIALVLSVAGVGLALRRRRGVAHD